MLDKERGEEADGLLVLLDGQGREVAKGQVLEVGAFKLLEARGLPAAYELAAPGGVVALRHGRSRYTGPPLYWETGQLSNFGSRLSWIYRE